MASAVRARNTQPGSKGTGRSSAENAAYAQAASLVCPRAVKLTAAERARRAKIAEAIIPCDDPLPPDELDRAVKAEIVGQMAQVRAAALTTRRKARVAAERAEQSERDLSGATGPADCGSDGVDAA